VKNQGTLVEAWARSVWRTHNLALIGGDLDHPTPTEREMLCRISDVLAGREELTGRFAHLSALPNRQIRAIQSYLAGRGKGDIYVCPSLKEEFGLSILEAMASAMVVCAPVQGGAGGYIRHGINGFLIDTADSRTLESEMIATALNPALHASQRIAIGKNAVETVRQDFSIETMAHRFSRFYGRVLDD
jgi:glycosyltransferase involved in cell wall biosynthesis